MTGFKTLYYNGEGLLFSQLVLDQMGLKNGQGITKEQFLKAIGLNAAQFAADMDMRRLAGEKDIPNTTELKEKLKRLQGL